LNFPPDNSHLTVDASHILNKVYCRKDALAQRKRENEITTDKQKVIALNREELANSINDFLSQQLEIYGDGLAVPLEQENNVEDTQSWRTAADLEDLHGAIQNCASCALGSLRNKFVFGSGNPHADIMLIGEGPGAEEDQSGLPFVGAAGQLLDKILASIGLSRDQVYICNILKCRPPQNRDPESEEINNCIPYLQKQIALINPKFILCLGRIAAQALLKTPASLNLLRLKIYNYEKSRLIVTYHPAALLRYPQYKKDTWEDVKFLRRQYEQWLSTGA
jgi:uracil-DNA glycosylase